MVLEISDKEKELLKHILEYYLGELREEVVKAEDVKWKLPLH